MRSAATRRQSGDVFNLHDRGTLDVQGDLDLRLRVLSGRDMVHLRLIGEAPREATDRSPEAGIPTPEEIEKLLASPQNTESRSGRRHDEGRTTRLGMPVGTPSATGRRVRTPFRDLGPGMGRKPRCAPGGPDGTLGPGGPGRKPSGPARGGRGLFSSSSLA
ncbi:MAG TPA: hypothetical protein VKP69_04155 [Isosphaeraceae bacterium]|nr:hypothetical protein [Isosphaeraceae bacterium]